MGTCASIQFSKNGSTLLITNGSGSPSTSPAILIHSVDGTLQEFRHPIKASNVLSNHPNTVFLCSADNMFVNCHVPHVPADEELQPGQIYFLLPVSKSCRPISLQELCSLAITASSALEKGSAMKKGAGTASFSGRRMPSFNGRRKRNGSGRRNDKVDFQLALKKLG